MDDALGYKGKRVVVTGAASGMGEATAAILGDLGARVTALDIKEPTVSVDRFVQIDLRDQGSIDAAVASITDTAIDGLFSCAGLPGPPFSEFDTMLVNFVGARHLAESLVPHMSTGSAISVISSSAAIGWEKQTSTTKQLLETTGFDAAVEWLQANEATWNWSGYAYSKYVIDAWVGWWYPELAPKGIRINCINPGPTETAMMPAFQDLMGKDVIDDAMGPVGRYSRAEEQAWPLVCLGSPRMSYVGGSILWTDGGWYGAMTMGRHQADWAEETAKHA
ncbi:SDR family oxidoreductase [uncultured Williamsia sp.]|uniref:SDR family oxidoreductase n=1 Tax=uncultured Williamsia sp. TaxID=259311 RepID=UPI0026031E8A|nr:SDR family oxidoreductase [uncultured Williamsia sp.]